MPTHRIYAEQVEDVFVLKSVYNLAIINKANIDGSNTVGGNWYIDAIFSDLFPSYKQVLKVIGGQMAIEYGNVQLDTHRFIVTAINGLKVKVGANEHTIYHSGNLTNVSQLSNDAGYLDATDLDGFIYDVQYNATTHRITFYQQNEPNIVVDLPIESLIKNVQLVGNDLVFTFEDNTTVTVPLNTLLVGVVKSVNGKTPNSQGEIVLQVTDIPNLSSELANKLDVRMGGLVSNLTQAEKDAILLKLGVVNNVIQTLGLSGTTLTLSNSGGSVTLNIANINGLQNTLDGKQNQLTAGANIQIDPNTNIISATDTTYTFSVGVGLGILKVGNTIEYSIGQAYLDKIQTGKWAYSWGNHANAGYLKQADLNGYATENWVSSNFSQIGHTHIISEVNGLQGELNKIGNLPSLKTTYKTDLVGAINEVNQKNDNLKIGGRNLLKDDWSSSIELLQGETYTLSFRIKAPSPTGYKYVHLWRVGQSWGSDAFATFDISNNTDLISVTFVCPITDFYYFVLESQNWNYEYAQLPTLQLGNKATEWHPAPEDCVADWNQSDSTKYNFIKNKPLSFPTNYNLQQIMINGNRTNLPIKFDGNIVLLEVDDPAIGWGATTLLSRGWDGNYGGDYTELGVVGHSVNTASLILGQNGVIYTKGNGNSSQWDYTHSNALMNRGTSFISNIDANNIQLKSEVYSIETANGSGNINFPVNSAYGVFFRQVSNAFVTDWHFGHSEEFFFKTWFIPNGAGSVTWRKVIDDQNINSYLSNYYTQSQALGLFVGLNGVQTIADTKTFTSSPVIPNATLNAHAVNLGQLNSLLVGYATQNWVTSQGYQNATQVNQAINNAINNSSLNTWNGFAHVMQRIDATQQTFIDPKEYYTTIVHTRNQGVSGIQIDDHDTHGARLILRGTNGNGANYYDLTYYNDTGGFIGSVNIENGARELAWDDDVKGWIDVGF